MGQPAKPSARGTNSGSYMGKWRVDGKPRIRNQQYLGTSVEVLARLSGASQGTPERTQRKAFRGCDHQRPRTPLKCEEPATLDGPDALHVHAKWTFAQILHAKNVYLGKSDKALIDGSRVGDHEGSSLLVGLRTPTGWQSPRLSFGMRSSPRHSN